MLQETKLNREEGQKLENKMRRWKMHLQKSRGASGGLGLKWNHRRVCLKIIESRHSWMSCHVKGIVSYLHFLLINVYGPIHNPDKKVVWA